jgi:chromosomal replication initiation ATPase DnaA
VTDGAQLVFDLVPRAAHGRENFLVSDCNRDAVTWIDRWPEWPVKTTGLNVYGPAASGKTHLAAVWRARSQALRLDRPIEKVDQVPSILGDARDVVIDDLDAGWPGEPLLHLHNLVAERAGVLLVLSRIPSAQLGIEPPDLSSRLAAMPAVAIGAPDDELIIGVMSKLFRDRQLQVGRDVLEYMASRMRRSLAEAARLVDELDRSALAERRRITLPLARSVLSVMAALETNDHDEIRGE